MCDLLEVKINRISLPNFDFAYGFSLAKKEEVVNKKGRVYEFLAPWVKVAIEKGML